MNNPPLVPDTQAETIEELFARDPLLLTEEDLTTITEELIRLTWSHRAEWVKERDSARADNRRISGTAVKKRQALSSSRQTAKAIIGKMDLDLG